MKSMRCVTEIALIDYNLQQVAPVAQLDRVLGYEPRGRGFESCRARQFPKCHLLAAFFIPGFAPGTSKLLCSCQDSKGDGDVRSHAKNRCAGVARRDRILPGAPVSKMPPLGGIFISVTKSNVLRSPSTYARTPPRGGVLFGNLIEPIDVDRVGSARPTRQ